MPASDIFQLRIDLYFSGYLFSDVDLLWVSSLKMDVYFFLGICLWRLLVTRIPRGFHGNKENTRLLYVFFLFPYQGLSASPANVLRGETSPVSLFGILKSGKVRIFDVCRQWWNSRLISLSDKIDRSSDDTCIRCPSPKPYKIVPSFKSSARCKFFFCQLFYEHHKYRNIIIYKSNFMRFWGSHGDDNEYDLFPC